MVVCCGHPEAAFLASHSTESRASFYRASLALAAAGFQRYATYRQAMVAAVVTNSVFGFLRFAVMLDVIETSARAVAGYSAPQLATFVWAEQGLIAVVLLRAMPKLAERIRTGDVITDLLRPIDPVWQLLAADLGRAGYAVLTRFVVPVVVGALAFDLYAPRRPVTYALFAWSVLLATLVCFGCRYLVKFRSKEGSSGLLGSLTSLTLVRTLARTRQGRQRSSGRAGVSGVDASAPYPDR